MKRKNSLEKETKSRKKSQEKRTLEEKLLEELEGVIIRHPTIKEKWKCIICEKSGSLHYVGYWNNCRDHIASKGIKRRKIRNKNPLKLLLENMIKKTTRLTMKMKYKLRAHSH